MGLQDLMDNEHQIVHAYEVSGWGCMISGVRNNNSNMNTRYQDGLQDLTCKEHQIEYANKVSGRDAGSHGLGTTDRTCLLGFRR